MSDLSEMNSSDLAALLCSRVCHDIAGPTSAMGAALSVLDDESATDMHTDAIDLLRTGAVQIRNKLEYVRVCFGAAGSRGGDVALTELKGLTDAMFGDARATVSWKSVDGDIDKLVARVLLNLVWLGVEALPRGGEVVIETASSGDGGARLRVVSTGARLRFDAAYVGAFEGAAPENGFDGRSIQPYYAGLLARESGGRAEASQSEERLEIAALIGPGRHAVAAE
jgi:histidine phosphotransferase ChpT